MIVLRGFLMATLLIFALGCGGGSGGKEGDAQDPAKSSDDAQMQDETGDVGNPGGE